MLRLKLNEKYRLQVWSRTLQIPGVSEIHSHPWGFRSLVIAGRIDNQRFKLVDDSDLDPEPDPIPYEWAFVKCGPDGGLVSSVGTCGLIPQKIERVKPGESYAQNRDEIHRTTPVEGTVTLLEKYHPLVREETLPPKVFWQLDQEFVSAASRKATMIEVLTVVTAALDTWF